MKFNVFLWIIFGVSTALFLVSLSAVIWFNRGSPRVWEVLIPAVLFGIFVPLTATFNVLATKSSEDKFPVVLHFRKDANRLISIEDMATYIPAQSASRSAYLSPDIYDNDIYNDAFNAYLLNKYGFIPRPDKPIDLDVDQNNIDEHDEILKHHQQAFIIGLLWDLHQKFNHTWFLDVREMKLPKSVSTEYNTESPYDSAVYTWDDIRGKLSESGAFSKEEVPEFIQHSLGKGLHLPPGTELSIKKLSALRTVIKMKSAYFDIQIGVRPKTFGSGIGRVQRLLGGYDKGRDLYHFAYVIEFNARFARILSGHPMMTKYQNWADDMFHHIKRLDYERMLEELKEWRSYR